MNRFIAGALGGFVATVPMTVVMERLFQKLPQAQRYPLPPREITEVVVKRLPGDDHFNDQQMAQLSLSAHFAYGALTGALYPLIFREPRRQVLLGGAFGVGVWAASYLGWLPVANILRPATGHPRLRNGLMLSAHWVWGASTIIVGELLAARLGTSGFSLRQPSRDAFANLPLLNRAGQSVARARQKRLPASQVLTQPRTRTTAREIQH